ncbi:MAG: 50S ribosomal protein L31 [Patescibacteria group bacterium]|nr:50S ribosomal protein L31 [Patescibacteria group bacterium]
MKKDIHPKYYSNCKVTCACGNVFTTGSTLEEIKVDICSACHPFFTGKMKFIDTMGRVEKFQKKQAKAKKNKYTKKVDRKRIKEKIEKAKPRTLKEMIEQQKKQLKRK